jgi:hypothetical protein
MQRREFLIGTVAATGLIATSRLRAQAGSTKLARVGVLSRNFDAVLKQGVGPAPVPTRTVDFMDLPQMIADKLGVHNLELQHSHFVSTEPAYLKDFSDRVAKSKSKIIQINTDFQGSNVSAGGFSQRAQGIDLVKVWIDHAEALGCPRVMISPGSLAPEVRQSAIDALKVLAEYGKAHKVSVTLENRNDPMPVVSPAPPPAAAAAGAAGGGGGQGRGRAAAPPAPPVTWQTLVEVIKAAGIAATPDTGGFSNDADRPAGLKALYPLSDGNSHVHTANLAAAIKIANDASYKGIYSIAIDGPGGSDPFAATKTILDAVVKLI